MDELLSRQCGLHSYEGVSVNASFHGNFLHSEVGEPAVKDQTIRS